ncbi:hypothetical protein [Mycobacterium phage Maco6]|nr:hypothetical protein [Mycobacterium phage Maco6]
MRHNGGDELIRAPADPRHRRHTWTSRRDFVVVCSVRVCLP